jgi:hypothetical protein
MEWISLGKRKKGRSRTTEEMGIWKAISERNLAKEQWNNRREWQLGIRQQRRTF